MPDASLEAWHRRLGLMMLVAFAVAFALGRPEVFALMGSAGVLVAEASLRTRRGTEQTHRLDGVSLLLGGALGVGVDTWPRFVSAGILLVGLGAGALRRSASRNTHFRPVTDAFALLVGALALEHRVAPGGWVALPGVLLCLLALARVPARAGCVKLALLALAAGFASDHPVARGVLLVGVTSVSLVFGASLLGRAVARLS